MKRLLVLLALIWLAIAPATAMAQDPDYGAMSTDDLIEIAPAAHPVVLYLLASKLLAQGKGQEAANWMYAGQLRYRFLLTAQGGGPGEQDAILFSALSEQVGRPVNEYIAGDVDEWMAAMDWALQWDAEHDNAITDKTEHADVLAEIRAGLEDFRDSIDGQREEIARLREQNGLENR